MNLGNISVIGLGLLGGSISLAVRHYLPKANVVGYSHRLSTRRKARRLRISHKIADDLCQSVSSAELVIIATPVFTFEQVFSEIAACLRPGCIVTDVGSTKVLPHRWAAGTLPSTVYYVGSHPVAGSEQRGVEFARPDLFEHSCCILTKTKTTHQPAVKTLKHFWSKLGCSVCSMTPPQHDRILSHVSHLPHILATSLVNATDAKELKFAGKGFADTTRIASSPPNIWTDILLSNAANTSRSINHVIARLLKLKKAIDSRNRDEISKFLESARRKRAVLLRLQDT